MGNQYKVNDRVLVKGNQSVLIEEDGLIVTRYVLTLSRKARVIGFAEKRERVVVEFTEKPNVGQAKFKRSSLERDGSAK